MALTTSTITGRVPLPTDENLQYAELTFALSGLDTEGADVLPGGISKRIILVESDIPSGFDLWQNTAGLHGTHYRVLARWTVKDRDGVRDQYADLGIIQVGASASYTLASLLNSSVPEAIGTFWSAISQEQYNAAIDAVALAQAWAESPTAPGDPGTKSAKTWAEEAEASAAALDSFVGATPFSGVTVEGVTDYVLPYNPMAAAFVWLHVGGVPQEPGAGFTLVAMPGEPSGWGFRLTFPTVGGLEYWGQLQRPLAADPNATEFTPEQFMGVGVSDAQAIQAALAAAAGRPVRGAAGATYTLSSTVEYTGSVNLDLSASRVFIPANVQGFVFSAQPFGAFDLTADYVPGDAFIDVALPADLRVAGQPIKIYSEAVDPANRDEGSSAAQYRCAEWAIVADGSTSSRVYLTAPLRFPVGIDPVDGVGDEARIPAYSLAMSARVIVPVDAEVQS